MINWTLTQLEYILAVDEHRNFSKAAAAVRITQPTLSMQIQKLEDDLGVILFDRSKKPIRPTEVGVRIVAQARSAVSEAKKIEWLAKQSTTEVSGDFRLGVIPTLSPYVVPRFLKSFAEAYPKVKLRLEELRTASILEALERDQIDAGLLATPLHVPGLVEDPLFYEPFYLFSQATHRLAQKKSVDEKDLDGSELWLLEEGHCLRSQMVSLCSLGKRTGAIFKNVQFESGSIETLISLVRSNGGYTLVPELALPKPIPAALKATPFKKPTPTREVSLVYRRTQLKVPILNAIKAKIVASMPTEMRQDRSKEQEVIEIV